MGRIALVFGFVFAAIISKGQPTNQWIDFNQVYYKIPVAKNGIYRVSYLQLNDVGFPVGSVDPQYLQVYHRGKEQAVLVSGEDDGQFNPVDYIEFFGQKNDGTVDTKLYDDPSFQPHTYFNLFSDTTAYFLTIGGGKGKRMNFYNESNAANLAAEPYYLHEKLLLLTEDYAAGPSEVEDIYTSNYDMGEGWTSSVVRQGQSKDFELTGISNGVTTGPAPELELILVGRSKGDHSVQIYGGSSMRLLDSPVVPGFNIIKLKHTLDWNDITVDGKLPIRIQVLNNGNIDYVSVSLAKLTYPRATDAGGASEFVMKTRANPAGQIFLSLANPASGSRIFDISDPENVSLIGATQNANLDAVIDNTEVARSLYVSTAPLTPSKITKVAFRDYTSAQNRFVIITHPLFRRSGGNYADPVKAYASYRASAAGGGYDTLVAHTQQLFDQFSYGESTPFAITAFLRHLSSVTPPEYLFIIGKGVELWYRPYRNPPAPGEFQDYVPASGFPASDMMYSVGIGGSGYDGGIPTGRLPATNPGHVAAYLDKIVETESLPYDNLWRKKILHLSGGIETFEPELFKSSLEVLAGIAEGPYVGAKVDAIAKKSREVQVINISKEVNQGLGLITFLGHSSTSTLDFDIGYVTDPALGYKNRGKYPMMIMNGCEVGSFFYKYRLFGEDWVLADKAGASAFIGHNSYGLVSHLFSYSKAIYEVGFADLNYIGKGIGDIKLEGAKRYLQNSNHASIDYSQVQQMILLGDPAVPLFGAKKPELELKASNLSVVSLTDQPLTSQYDSFAVKMIIRNYGIVKPELVRVQVERVLSDNSSVFYDSLVNMPANSDTLLFVIRKRKEVAAGANLFRVTVDADNIIEELNEDNNTGEVNFVFPVNGTKNLYPLEFAIVNKRDVQLTVQSTDVYLPERDFMIEIDTLSSFDSPFKQNFVVKGKVIAFKLLQLLDQDTLAYYWRSRLANPTPGESSEWTTTSFTYIQDGGDGWAQVHFPQFKNDAVVGLVRDYDLRKISFEKSVIPVSVRTFGAAANKPVDSTLVYIDNTSYNMSTQGWGCRNNTINLIAFDRKSTYPYLGIDLKWYEVYQYGRLLICGRQPFVINSFQWDEVSSDIRPDLIDYISNIAPGDSVVLYTIGNAGIDMWSEDAKLKLAEFGISLAQLDALQNGEGVVIFAKKGADPGTAKFYITDAQDPSTGTVSAEETITGGYSSGTMTSWIGPAQSWESIVWKVSELEQQDNVTFNLYGKKPNGDQILLSTGTISGIDISSISAEEYPYLKAEFYTEDNLLLSSPQLENWIVHFVPMAEGVLLPATDKELINVQEGEPITESFNFINISDTPFSKNLQVRYTLFNHIKSEGVATTTEINAPAPGDTTNFSVVPSSVSMREWNDLEVYVNPKILPEKYYDNNLIQLPNHIFVSGETIAPVTDVTFDGRHIANNDFVSPSTHIKITMWDENPYLLKTDTIGIRVYLTGPCETGACTKQYIPFSSGQLVWHPASISSNFRIDYNPTLSSGQYILSVETADASGNSAAKPFEISFIVEEEFSLTFTGSYPNPFNYELFYGFKLSGKDNVENVTFEVRDISGRKLYSLINYETRPVGTHQFSWEGIDNGFNYLKTGVYFIRLQVTVAGKQYEHQEKVILAR